MSPGEQISPPELERWWLIFQPPVERRWWGIFVRKDYGHVYAFRMPVSGVLLALNPLVHRVENAIIYSRACDVITDALAAGHKVLVYERHTRVYNAELDVRVGRGWLITCASHLAYTLGINFSWRCTPYQLYRAALRAGAQELERRQEHLQPAQTQEGQGRREAP